MRRNWFLALLVIMAVGCAGIGQSAAKGEVPRMSKEELKGKLASPDLVILDVRADSDWKGTEKKISGAVRENPKSFEQWAAKYPKEKTLVLYCA